MKNIIEYNGKQIAVKKYFQHYVVGVSELIHAFDITNKSGRDVLRSDVPQDSAITIPRDKRSKNYYLKRDGVVAFLKKYKPEELEQFMVAFDAAVKFAEVDVPKPEEALKLSEHVDPYAIDLLEDILKRINQTHLEAQKFYDAAVTMYSRQMFFLLEMESLYSKVAAMLLRAESLGPIARINKELTRDLIALGKEAFNDAMACDQSLKEYEDFGKEEREETHASHEESSNNDSETSGLLIRTDKKHKNSRK